jgi:hypothetical protein
MVADAQRRGWSTMTRRLPRRRYPLPQRLTSTQKGYGAAHQRLRREVKRKSTVAASSAGDAVNPSIRPNRGTLATAIIGWRSTSGYMPGLSIGIAAARQEGGSGLERRRRHHVHSRPRRRCDSSTRQRGGPMTDNQRGAIALCHRSPFFWRLHRPTPVSPRSIYCEIHEPSPRFDLGPRCLEIVSCLPR